MHYLTLLHNVLSFGISIVLVCLFLSYFRFFSYIFAFQKLTGLSVTMDVSWTFRKTKENENTFKYELYHDTKPVSVKQAVNLLYNSNKFRNSFIKELSDAPFEAFFFETPPVDAKSYDKLSFEFVLVKSKGLPSKYADADAFREHFDTDCTIAKFSNLGRDALMIAPCPLMDTESNHYVHLASFVRFGKAEQVHQLWRSVASAMVERVRESGEHRTWLSTSGLGVNWLHVRLDSRPKYYTYTPYKS